MQLLLPLFILLTGLGLGLSGCNTKGRVSSSSSVSSRINLLKITPNTDTISLGQSIELQASGGTAPYQFDLYLGDGSIKTKNQDTSIYTSPDSSETIALVRVKDATGDFGYATIQTTVATLIHPQRKTLSLNNSFPFSAMSGIPPYTFSHVSGVGSINPTTGEFISDKTGLAVVMVTDSKGMSSKANIAVNSPLTFINRSTTVSAGENLTVRAIGGVPRYTYSIIAGEGEIDPIGGAFKASDNPGTVTVQVRDTYGSKKSLILNIKNSLSINQPASYIAKGKSFQFTASGGNPPYTFSVVSGGVGQISSAGLYSSTALGTATIKVTDSKNHTDQATVTVDETYEFSASNVQLAVGGTADLSKNVVGGVKPYTFSAASGDGSINGSTYTAPDIPGTYTVTVYDNSTPDPKSIEMNIIVNSVLTLSPETPVTLIDTNLNFSSTGGVPPYTYVIKSGAGTISSDGIYKAPHTPGTAEIKVTDTLNNTFTTQVEIKAPVIISPLAKDLMTGDDPFTFTAQNGEPPYSYKVLSGAGSIHDSSGVYKIPNAPGIATIQVEDSLGSISQSDVHIYRGLKILPPEIAIKIGTTTSFMASGGLPPYEFVMITGNGKLDPATGTFAAPNSAGTSRIKVTDALDNSVEATITIYDQLLITPITKNILVDQPLNFTAMGGTPPYKFEIINSGVGSLNGSTFTSSITGESFVRVTDALGDTSNAHINVSEPLSITPNAITLAVNNSASFKPDGGIPPYSFYISKGKGVIQLNGDYTAPDSVSTDNTETVTLKDSVGNSITAEVTLNGPLALAPDDTSLNAGGTLTLEASGGLSPYNYSIVTGAGSLTDNIYTAERINNGGKVTLKVVDALGNKAQINATIPVISLAMTTPNSTTFISASNQAAMTVSGTCSELDKPITLTASGGITGTTNCVLVDNKKTWTTTLNLSSAPDGDVTLTANHKNANNVAAKEVLVVLKKDGSLPTLAITTPDPTSNTNPTPSKVVITGTCTKEGLINITGGTIKAVSSCDAGNYSATIDLTSVPDGPLTLSLEHSDKVGNTTTAKTVTIQKDGTPPAITAFTVANTSPTNTRTFNLTFTATGDPVKYCILENSVDNKTCTWNDFPLPVSFEVSAKNEAKTLSAWVQDNVGNISTRSDSAAIILNTEPTPIPTMVLKTPTQATSNMTSPIFTVGNVVVGDKVSLYSGSCPLGSGGTLLADKVPVTAGTSLDIQPTLPLSVDGQYSFYVQTTNIAGTVSITCSTPSVEYLLDTVAPTVTTLTTANNGPFKATDILNISILFNEKIKVVGKPTLDLDTGRMGAQAVYNSGTDSETLEFKYTVSSGDNSADLTYTDATSLKVPAGVTLKDEAGNNAVLTLPNVGTTGSLSDNQQVVIDTTPSSVTTFNVTNTSPTNTLTYNLTYTASNDSAEYCILENSTSEASCIWTPLPLPTTFEVTATNNAKVLSAWTRDSLGNISVRKDSDSVTLNSAPTPVPTLVLKTPASATSNSDSPTFTVGKVVAGDKVSLYSGSCPGGTLIVDKAPVTSGTTITLVLPTPLTTEQVYNFYAQTMNSAGTLSDTCSTPSIDYEFDMTAPTLTSVTASSNGPFKTGDIISFSVLFNEKIKVVGKPTLELNTGRLAAKAVYDSGTNTNTLIFKYKVMTGDSATDLSYIDSNSLSLPSGSALTDNAGNAAVFALPAVDDPGSLSDNQQIVIDTLPPTINIFSVTNTSPTNTTTYGLNFTATNDATEYCILEDSISESSCVWTPVPLPTSFEVTAVNKSKVLSAWTRDAIGNLSVRKDSAPVILNTDPTPVPTLTLKTPVSSPSNIASPQLLVGNVKVGDKVSIYTGSCPGGTLVVDKASVTTGTTLVVSPTVPLSPEGTYGFYAQTMNSAGTLSLTCSTPSIDYTLDTTSPTLSHVTASGNGPFKSGDVITLSLLWSEKIKVVGKPTLDLNTGRSGAQATYNAGDSSNTLTFKYTVASGDNSSDLTYTNTTSLKLAPGVTLKDEAGNDVNLNLPVIGSTGSLTDTQEIVIDTTPPTISTFSVTNTSPTNSRTFNLNFTASNDSAEYCILENSTSTSSCTWNAIPLPTTYEVSAMNNAKVLSAWTRDAVGNISDRKFSDSITLNTNPTPIPTLTLKTPTTTPTNITSPVFNVGNVTAGDKVSIYSGTCLTGTLVVDMAPVAAGPTLQVSPTSPISVEGTYSYYAITTNNAGTTSVTCSTPAIQYVLDLTAPNLTSVTATSDGPYKATDVITISILFSENITVVGTPYLELSTGRIGAKANYSSGSGTGTLIFKYTVTSGDNTLDLTYPNTNSLIIPSGASLKDEAGNNASIILPTAGSLGSLSTNQEIIVDTIAPTISAFVVTNSSPTNNQNFTLSFSAANEPFEYCILENSTAMSGCSWNPLPLPTSYQVTATNNTKTLSAWVRDNVGNVTSRYDSAPIVLNTAPTPIPTLTLKTPNSAIGNVTSPVLTVGKVTAGDKVSIYSGSCPDGTLLIDKANVSSGTTLDVTISPALSLETTYSFYALTYNNAGSPSLTCSTPVIQYKLDVTAPSILSVIADGDGPFKAADVFNISVLFSENVVVTGTPAIDLATGRNGAQATYVSGSGSNTLVFKYTAVLGDSSPDLTYSATNSLKLPTGATLKDEASNVANLTLPTIGNVGSLSYNQQILIDTVAPVVSTFSVANSSPTNNPNFVIDFLYQNDPVDYCILENSTTVANCSWQPLPLPTNYMVTNSNNAKVLSAWLRDAVGNVSVRKDSNSVTLNTQPASIPTLKLKTPASSPSSTTAPVLTVGNVSVGDKVSIYSGSCPDGVLLIDKSPVTVGSTLDVTISPALVAEGNYSFYALNTNNAGTISLTCSIPSVEYKLDTTAPTVVSVKAASDGPFKAGDIINLTVQFSESMSVYGSPTLDLTTGRIGASAAYASGTGTDTLTFKYTVVSGDNSADLTYTNTTSLKLSPGSTLKDLAGNNATLALPSIGGVGSLSDNQQIIIDTLVPTISAFTISTPSPTNQTTFNFTTTTTNDPFEYCILENSTVISGCTWSPVPVPTSYVVTSTNNTKVLSAWVRDAVGNVSARVDSNSITVNTSVPKIPTLAFYTTTTSPGNLNNPSFFASNLTVGDKISLYSGSCPDGTLLIDKMTVNSATNMLLNTPIAQYLTNEGTYNFYVITHTIAGTPSPTCSTPGLQYVYDKTAPAVTKVSADGDGPFNVGDIINFTVEFSENVIVAGTPALELNTGRSGASVNYLSGSGSNKLVFKYTIIAGDNSTDLSYPATTSLKNMSMSSVKDAAGNAANLALPVIGDPGSLSYTQQIVIDTTVPTVSALTINNTSPTNTRTFDLTFTATDNPTEYCILENLTTIASCVWSPAPLPTTYQVADTNGAKVLSAWVRDSAGNVSATRKDSNSVTYSNYTPEVPAMAYSNPASSPAKSLTPIFNVGKVVVGDVVTIYTGSCPGGTSRGSVTVTAANLVNTNTVNVTSSSLTNAGAYTFYAKTVSSAGIPASSCSVGLDYTVDLTAPTVTKIYGESDGIYGIGGSFKILIEFSKPVVVTGNPIAYVQSVRTGAGANYTSGSGTNTLTFTYNVLASDNSARTYVTTMSVISGTINDLAGNSANVTSIPTNGANSLYTSNTIVMDGTAPSAPSSIVDGVYLNSNTETPPITFTTGTDTTSGILKHQAQVLKSSDSTVVLDWTDITSNGKITGLSLSDGIKYLVQLRSVDKAGNFSALVKSDGWIVDITKPNKPGAITIGAALKVYTSTPNLTFAVSTDPTSGTASGVSYYEARVLNADTTEFKAYTTITSGTGVASSNPYIESNDYSIAIRAVDNAGNASDETSVSWTAMTAECSAVGDICHGGGILLYAKNASYDGIMSTPGKCSEIPVAQASDPEFDATCVTSKNPSPADATKMDYLKMNWADAKSYCEKMRFGNYSDWTLPDKTTITIFGGSLALMPGAISDVYASATEDTADLTKFYTYNPKAATLLISTTTSKNNLTLVRCIRRIPRN